MDRLTPAQARRLRLLVTQDDELAHAALGNDPHEASPDGLPALIGSIAGPADLAEEHDRHIEDRFRSGPAGPA